MSRWIVIMCVMITALGLRAGDLTVDGKLIATDGLDATGNRIENVADPINPTDSANKQYVDIPGYIVASKQGPRTDATLQTIITGLSGTPATIVIDGTWNITSNLTVPANVSLKFWNGGILDVATDIDLAINGNIEAGIYQIFDVADIGTGSIECTANEWVHCEWYGIVKGVDTPTACAQNLLAIDVAQRYNSKIQLGVGIIYVADTVIIHEDCFIRGVLPPRGGKNAHYESFRTTIKASTSFPYNDAQKSLIMTVEDVATDHWRTMLSSMHLDGSYRAHTIYRCSSQNEGGGLRNLSIINFLTYGLHLKSSYVHNCSFKNMRISLWDNPHPTITHVVGILMEEVGLRVVVDDVTIDLGYIADFGQVSLDNIDASATFAGNYIPTQGVIAVAVVGEPINHQVNISNIHPEQVDIGIFHKGSTCKTAVQNYAGFHSNICELYIADAGHSVADDGMFVGLNLMKWGTPTATLHMLINKYNDYEYKVGPSTLSNMSLPFYSWKNSNADPMDPQGYQFALDGTPMATLEYVEQKILNVAKTDEPNTFDYDQIIKGKIIPEIVEINSGNPSVVFKNTTSGADRKWQFYHQYNASYDDRLKINELEADGTWVGTPFTIIEGGNVGIGTSTPARKLHVSDAMRLQPIASAPASPAEGDIYMDSTTHKLMVYDGAMWQACW